MARSESRGARQERSAKAEPWRFDGSEEAGRALDRLVEEIDEIQRTLVENHERLRRADRAAHQQQIAGGRVVFRVSHDLPPELDGLGIFQQGSEHAGIGRVSTGLGCPHLETDPDFLGLMLAFRAPGGRRIDFLGINDPGAPTDTAGEFLALLAATADAAGTDVPFGRVGELDLGNLGVSQLKLYNTLRKRLGITRAAGVFFHIAHQTARTLQSTTALQTYWTGVVEARGVLGKFTFVPTVGVNTRRPLRPGEHYLTDDWNARWKDGDLEFGAYWIPHRDEETTPLESPSETWTEMHRLSVGTVVFPRTDARTREARLVALLASEMGANPGHWMSNPAGVLAPEHPATTFTAARARAYERSQANRDVLPESEYESFFETGAVSSDLEDELLHRYAEKRLSGHAVPDLGSFD